SRCRSRAPPFPYTTLFRSLDSVAAPIRVPVVIPLRPVTVRYRARKKSNPVMMAPDTDITKIGAASGPPPTAPQNVRLKRISESRSEEHTSELQSPYDIVCR